MLPAFAAVEAGSRLLPLPAIAALLGVRIARTPRQICPGGQLPAHAVGIFEAAAIFYHGTSRRDRCCLPQALIAGSRLRHLGPQLVIGADRPGGKLAVHAWLEIDGHPLGNPGHFKALTGAGGQPPSDQ